MFGDNNQSQQTNDNNANNNGQVDAPDNSNTAGGLSSFTMDRPKDTGPSLPPTRAADISPPPPPAPLPDISTVDESEALRKIATAPDSGTSNAVSGDADLINIKQQALSQLSPMLSHLDQSPEEKFKTIMMMIQASDNKDLIKQAYEAAEQITDEKSKAQALLDVVNEINYFTHKEEE